MWNELKKFAVRGNVLDMAVGFIVGAAFTTVVRSLVDDVVMPPIGLLTGGADFSDLFITLGPGEYASLAEAQEAGAATLNYGLFINNLLAFLIVVVVVFFLVRGYNRLQQREAGPPPPPTERQCPFCMLLIPVAATRCGHCTSELPASG